MFLAGYLLVPRGVPRVGPRRFPGFSLSPRVRRGAARYLVGSHDAASIPRGGVISLVLVVSRRFYVVALSRFLVLLQLRC